MNAKFSNLQKLSLGDPNFHHFHRSRQSPLDAEDEDEESSQEEDAESHSQLKHKYPLLKASKLLVLPHLTHLNLLELTSLTTEVFVKVIPCFPALQMLVVTGCYSLLPKAVTESLATYCPKLETIAIERTQIP